MKKLKTLSLLILSLIVGLLPSYAQAAAPKLWVNGQYVNADVAPVVESQRVLVPLRVISETLGYKVTWHQETQAIEITGSTNYVFFLGVQKALRLTPEFTSEMLADIENGTPTIDAIYKHGSERVIWDLDVPPKAINNRTMVPIRIVAELLGNNVYWDQANYVVVIGDGYEETGSKASNNTFEAVTVERVIDGDTIVVSGNRKVRLILVDTPETKHPKKGVEYFGKEASAYTTSQLAGKTVYLQKDVSETDRYGRLLRYVWLARPSSNEPNNDEMASLCFNATLIKNGYGKLATFPPDIKYVDLFKSLERQARQANTGLWAGGTAPEAPKPTPKKPVAKPKASAPTKTYNSNPINAAYIGNSNTGKFHKRSCPSVNKMSPHNMVGFSSRNDAIGQGYSPCGRCHP